MSSDLKELNELTLRKLLLRVGLHNAVSVYAKLLNAGYSVHQILTSDSLAQANGYKNAGSWAKDGQKIYEWTVLGDLTRMSTANPKDPANARGTLRKMMSEATSDLERALAFERQSAIERFESKLTTTVRAASQRKFSEDILKDAPAFDGLYVYSFRVWIDNPDDTAQSKYRMKIGKAYRDGGIKIRLKEQVKSAKTSMPQPLLPLRAYRFDFDLKDDGSRDQSLVLAVEQELHRNLTAAGMKNPDYSDGETGQEWFSSSLGFVDSRVPLLRGYQETVELYTPLL